MINIKKLQDWFKNRHHLDKFELGNIYIVNKNFFFHSCLLMQTDNNGEVMGYISKFNLSDPLENILAKIASFYEVLNNVYQCALTDNRDVELKGTKIPLISISMRDYISLLGGTDGMDNRHISGENYEEVFFEGLDVSDNDRPLIPYEKGKTSIPKKEFYLLMQIYYGLYEEQEYLNELEENEKKGKYNKEKGVLSKYYDKDKGIVDWNLFYEFDRESADFELLEEYLKLKLIQQDISGAFGGLKVEKIYDKDWDETRQKEHIEAINKEFGEEVVVME